MKQWEYKVVDSDDIPKSEPGAKLRSFRLQAEPNRERAAVDTYLSQLGDAGWEIVAFAFAEAGDWGNFTGLAKRAKS